MKTYLILAFICLSSVSPALGEDKKSDAMKGAAVGESTKPEGLTVVVGANEMVESFAEPGWPIVISATTMPEEESAPAVPDNLRIKFMDEEGGVVPIVFESVAQPAGSDPSQRFWIAQGASTNGLKPGRYRVTFEDVKGYVFESGDVTIASDADKAALLDLLKIQIYLLQGKQDEAKARAEGLTAKDPNNADAWMAQGDILLSLDLPDEALSAYEQALNADRKRNKESLFIEKRYDAAYRRMLEKNGVFPESGAAQP